MIRSRLFSTPLVRKIALYPQGVDRYLSTQAKAIPTLEVSLRASSATGSKRSRALREDGLIPGVLYGYDDDRNILKINVVTHWKDLDRELRSKGRTFENTLYNLTVVDGSPEKKVIANYLVTPRQTTFNALTSKPLSVNFLRYKKGNRIAIPVDYVNSELSEAKKRNCTFIAVNSSIECICADEIPRVLKLDLSNAQKGDIYRLNAVEFPPKVRPSKTISPDTVICSVKAR